MGPGQLQLLTQHVVLILKVVVVVDPGLMDTLMVPLVVQQELQFMPTGQYVLVTFQTTMLIYAPGIHSTYLVIIKVGIPG